MMTLNLTDNQTTRKLRLELLVSINVRQITSEAG